MKKILGAVAKEKIVVLKNAASLLVMQGTNYLLPLIVLPYLSRILGPEKFGAVFFAQMFINYFMILSDYGFNFVGVRQIAQNKDNTDKVNSIVSSIYTLRVIFGLIGLIILLIVINVFSRFEEDKWIYIFTYGMVVGNILLPTWFFQGIQKMKYITLLNFLSKFTFTISIFFLVKNQGDYLLVPLLNGIGYIIAGVIGVIILKKYYFIKFFIVSKVKIREQLQNGFNVFMSNMSISAYTSTNAFILGTIVSNVQMGYYGGVEKLIQPFKFMFAPVYNAVFPYFAKLVTNNRDKAIKEMKWGVFLSVILGLCVFICIVILAEPIIILVLGNEFLEGINIFYVFSLLLLITPISYFLFNVVFLSFSLEKYSMKIYIAGGILNIIILITLLQILESASIAAALSNVITQFVNLILATLFLNSFIKKERRRSIKNE